MSIEAFSSSTPSAVRRGAAIVVVALHVGAIYALSQWTAGGKPTPLKAAPIQVVMVNEQRTPEPEVLPPPPVMMRSPVMVEMPLVDIPEVREQTRTIEVAYRTGPVAAFAKAAPAPKLISAVEYVRQPAPQYPPMSRRLREEGLVVLRVLIDPNGRAKQIELHQSSGYERLDRAACDALSRARFKPYLEDGVAHPVFALVPIEFTLNQRVAQR